MILCQISGDPPESIRIIIWHFLVDRRNFRLCWGGANASLVILRPASRAFQSGPKSCILRSYVDSGWCHIRKYIRSPSNTVIGRPLCNRGFPGYPGTCQKNQMNILESDRKTSNTIEQKYQMGSRRCRFRRPRNMSKNLKRPPRESSKRTTPEHVKWHVDILDGPKSLCWQFIVHRRNFRLCRGRANASLVILRPASRAFRSGPKSCMLRRYVDSGCCRIRQYIRSPSNIHLSFVSFRQFPRHLQVQKMHTPESDPNSSKSDAGCPPTFSRMMK